MQTYFVKIYNHPPLSGLGVKIEKTVYPQTVFTEIEKAKENY